MKNCPNCKNEIKELNYVREEIYSGKVKSRDGGLFFFYERESPSEYKFFCINCGALISDSWYEIHQYLTSLEREETSATTIIT